MNQKKIRNRIDNFRKILSFVVAVVVLGHFTTMKGEVVRSEKKQNANTLDRVYIKNFDLQKFVDQSLKSGTKCVTIPPGRYRVKPQDGQHLLLANLNDVQIVADGVEMICSDTIRALTIANCHNVTIRGLIIDYDPLPFTQGKITKISEDKKSYEVELFDGYPSGKTAGTFKYEIFRSDTRTLRCGDPAVAQVEMLDPRHLHVTNNGAIKAVVGDLIVTGVNYAPWNVITQDVDRYSSKHHAVVCDNNVNVHLDNIVLYASHWFGFFEHNCDGSVYAKCRIDRRPADTDIIKRGSPRLRSLNADAFHSTRASKGPTYIDCFAQYMGDDAINIHGDYHMITDCRDAELRVLARDDLNIASGDLVELFTYDGKRLPDAMVMKVERDGKINEEEKAFLAKQRLREIYRCRWNAEAWKITLDRDVKAPRGSMIISLRHAGNGFLIQDCEFGFNRSRGLLIRASDGKIVGNKLVENGMPAILIGAECFWLEGGNSRNVEIRNNTIIDCQNTAILVEGSGGLSARKRADIGTYRNIAIIGNSMTNCPLPNIAANSVDGLIVKKNVFQSPRGLKSGQDPATLHAVQTENSIHNSASNNVVK